MISCIILAAGLSSRFGSPKALALIEQTTIIEHIQQTLLKSSIGEIIIVLGAHSEEIKPRILNHSLVKFVYNKDYNFGQTSSFKVGLEHVSKKSEAVMLFPVDYPFVSEETIKHLIHFFNQNHPAILIPTFEDRKGHPPIFQISLRDELLRLDNSQGINSISQRHSKEVVLISVDDAGVLKTFNTKEEFEQLKADRLK